jgi:hypothetical protein
MYTPQRPLKLWISVALVLSAALTTSAALALEFDLAGAPIKVENLFTAGTLLRMQNRDSALIGKSNLQPGICVSRSSPGAYNDPNRRYSGNTCNPAKTTGTQSANTYFVNQPGSFSPNGDNGNLSYDRYDVVSAISKLTSDISFTYEEFHFFARTLGYFDVKYNNHQLTTADTTALPSSRDYSDNAKKLNGLNFKVLDYFVSRNFELAGHQLNLKVGNQVLNWGESSFLLANSLNAINPPDQALLREPGFDLKELLQPVGMVLLEGDIADGINFQTFYEYEWKPVNADPVGSFFSTSDIVGAGGDYAMLSFSKAPEDPERLYKPALNKDDPAYVLNSQSSRTILVDHAEADRREPRGTGQYGAALKFYLKELNNGTEVSLYYANYHSRIPSVSGYASDDTCLPATAGSPAQNALGIAQGCSPTNVAATLAALQSGAAQLPLQREALPLDSVRLFTEYPEDIHMFGTSFNTTVGDIAVSGEYVYRPNLPIQVHSTDLLFALLQPAFPVHDLDLGAAGTLPGRRSAVPDFLATNYRGAPPTAHSYVRGWEPMKVGQAGLTFLKIIGGDNILGASQITMLLEMGETHVFDFPDLSELQFNGAGTDTHISSGADGTVGINPRDVRTDPNNPATSRTDTTLTVRQNPTSYAQVDIGGFGTADSYGYRFLTLTRYDSALFGANVEFLNALFHDVGGVGPGIGQNFVEGRKQILSGIRFDYLSRFIGEIRYTWYTGGGLRDQQRDRDNLLLSVGYQF